MPQWYLKQFDYMTMYSSDFWAIGCILYQMISGKFPFQGTTTYLTWVKVKTLDYTFPDGFDETARDLVLRLLVRLVFFILVGYIWTCISVQLGP